LHALDIGPGIHDMVLHNNFIYVLDTSINSHVQTIMIDSTTNTLLVLGKLKIGELSISGSMPKKIYLQDRKLLVGTEKNAGGGELFSLPIGEDNMVMPPTRSIEVGGQVSDIYQNQGNIFIANASDTELFVYDQDFKLIYQYDAPLSLGNGKSVYYLEPYVYLGRTVSSFEIFFLEIKNNILEYTNKYKAFGTVDFIQEIGHNLLVMSSAESKELQIYSKNLTLIKILDLPNRVNAYSCFADGFLFSVLINNQSNIVWVK
jgi:hypothetical protein